MANEQEQSTFRSVTYHSFIFDHQFQRKAGIGEYIFTKKGLILLSGAIIASLVMPIEQGRYASLFLIGLFLYFFVSSKLKFNAKLHYLLGRSGSDEDSDSIFFFSKISLSKKKQYNAIKEIIKKKNIKDDNNDF